MLFDDIVRSPFLDIVDSASLILGLVSIVLMSKISSGFKSGKITMGMIGVNVVIGCLLLVVWALFWTAGFSAGLDSYLMSLAQMQMMLLTPPVATLAVAATVVLQLMSEQSETQDQAQVITVQFPAK